MSNPPFETIPDDSHQVLLDAIFEADPAGLAVFIGPRLETVYANPTFRYFLPNSGIDPIGKPYQQIWPTEEGNEFHQKLKKTLESGRPFQSNIVERRFTDGTRRFIKFQARRIDWNSNPACLLILWDTTDQENELRRRQAAEKELQRTKEEYRLLVENQTDMVARMSRDGRRLYVSPRFLELIGKTEEEVINTDYSPEIHPDDRERVAAEWQKTFEPPFYRSEIVARAQTTDGWRVLSWRSKAILDGKDEPTTAISVGRDITEQKRAEEALQESERKYLAIFQNAPFAISLLRLDDGVIADVNPAWESMFELEKKEVIGRTTPELGAVPDPLAREKRYAQLREKGDMQNFEMTYRTKSGKDFEVSNNASVISLNGSRYILLTTINITERRHAEEALRQSEATLEAFFANSPGILKIMDDQFRILKTDPTTPTYFGLDRESIIGKTAEKLSPAYFDEMGELLRRVIETGQPILNREISSQLPSRHGETASWIASYFPVPLPDGKRGLGMMGVEITKRKKAEQAVHESEERFRSVLENSLDVAYRRDLIQDRYDYMSPVVEQILGFTVDEINTMNLAQVMERIHSEDRSRIEHEMQTAMKTGKARLNYRLRTKNREYRWLADYVTISKDANGTPSYLTGILRDITAIKQAETELHLTIERLQAVVASPLIGIVIGDAQGNLYHVNDYYLNLLGYTREEFDRGQVHWDQLTPPEHLQADYQALKELEESGICTPYEKEYIRKDGSRVWVLINDALLPEEPNLIVGFVLDITERKRAEKEFLERGVQIELQHRLLEQREKERMQIARDLHDGPVQDLAGAHYALEVILHDTDDEVLRQGLQAVCDTIKNQVAELRNFASELRPPTLVKFGLGKGIISHLDSFRERHPELNIQFVEDAQVGGLVPERQRLALFRIYQEAMNNIAKHANASEVRIHMHKEMHKVIVDIQDNGRGFVVPRDWMDLVRKGHLGLAGMFERAEAEGGRLAIRSGQGEGTRIRVTMQIHPAEEE